MNSEKTAIGIVDDHTLFRNGMSALINSLDDMEVVLEAGNGKELLERLKFDQAQLLLLDLDMPEMSGTEVLPILKHSHPDIKVLIVTMHDDDNMILEVMKHGANGYLMKGADIDEVERAIRKVIRSDFYISDKVSRVMLQQVVTPEQFQPEIEPAGQLSGREMEVLQLVCREMTNAEIAEKLFISPRTVEGHRQRILQKIGARNTIGMVVFAIKEGIVEV